MPLPSGVSVALRLDSVGRVRQALPTARTAGFDGVTLPARLDASALTATGSREVRALLARHELRLCALHHTMPGFGNDPEPHAHAINRAVDAARLLGAELVAVDLSRLPASATAQAPAKPTPSVGGLLIPSADDIALFGGGTKPPANQGDSSSTAATDEGLRLVAEHADRAGVIVALGSSLSPTDALVTALRRADAPTFRALLDPVATLHDPRGGAGFLDDLGTQLAHVLGNDATTGDAGRTQDRPLGAGDVKWKELLAMLSDASFTGAISVDDARALDALRTASTV
ncbi:MAG: sugar phosphate isomerase/epimerase [Planctomycetota bacterium]